MRNIEIKARYPDLDAAEAHARRIAGEHPHARLRQLDTYFTVPSGRLKLREIEGAAQKAELIFYQRPDQKGPKRCDYQLAPVADPTPLKRLLATAFGVRVVVDKERTVYLYKNVRIHLDRVRGLGTFVEFEAVMEDDVPDASGRALLDSLLLEFGVAPDQLLEASYCDLLDRAGGEI